MFSGQTVLIVDDDPSQVLILSGYFQSQRAGAVIEANSAVDALERLRHSNSTVDLIVSDLMMPDMDGIEMLRELKKADYQGKLALVSSLDQAMINSARKLGEMHGVEHHRHLPQAVAQGQSGRPVSDPRKSRGAISTMLKNRLSVPNRFPPHSIKGLFGRFTSQRWTSSRNA